MIRASESALAPRVMLLVFGAVTLLCGAADARTQPAPRAAEPAITNGPRAWALATTALLTYRNGDRLDMLPPNVRSDSSVAEARGLLHDWWNVDNRSDLLQALQWLDREGHRAEFQRMGQSLLAMTDAQYQASLRAARDRPEMAGRMKLAREHYRKYRRNSLVAWDYGRYIMLCRWGYMVGFLREEQAWRRIMPAARTIQGSYRSWAELGEDYLLGREFWSREETNRTGRIYRDIEARLVKEPRSAWNQLPWRMKLEPGAPTRPR
jgi:uncharacterized protein DUF1266